MTGAIQRLQDLDQCQVRPLEAALVESNETNLGRLKAAITHQEKAAHHPPINFMTFRHMLRHLATVMFPSEEEEDPAASSGTICPHEQFDALVASVEHADMSKIGEGGGGGNPEDSDSPRTVKWRKENETREHMGLKPKVHPALKTKPSHAAFDDLVKSVDHGPSPHQEFDDLVATVSHGPAANAPVGSGGASHVEMFDDLVASVDHGTTAREVIVCMASHNSIKHASHRIMPHHSITSHHASPHLHPSGPRRV